MPGGRVVHAERREVIVELIGDDGVRHAGRFCECDAGRRCAANGEDKMSTRGDVRQRRADVVDCCWERERRIGEDDAVHRPTRQEVGDGWWEVFSERRRRAPPPQRRRSARPRGTSMGQMGGATRSDDGDRQLGRSHRDKWPVMYHEEH